MRDAEPVQFNEIIDTIRVTSNEALSIRLDQLDEAGIVVRRNHHEIPPFVEYSLTECGHEIATCIAPIVEWAERKEA